MSDSQSLSKYHLNVRHHHLNRQHAIVCWLVLCEWQGCMCSLWYFSRLTPSCDYMRTHIRLLVLYSKQWLIQQTYNHTLLFNQIFMEGQWTTMIVRNISATRFVTPRQRLCYELSVCSDSKRQPSDCEAYVEVLKQACPKSGLGWPKVTFTWPPSFNPSLH